MATFALEGRLDKRLPELHPDVPFDHLVLDLTKVTTMNSVGTDEIEDALADVVASGGTAEVVLPKPDDYFAAVRHFALQHGITVR